MIIFVNILYIHCFLEDLDFGCNNYDDMYAIYNISKYHLNGFSPSPNPKNPIPPNMPKRSAWIEPQMVHIRSRRLQYPHHIDIIHSLCNGYRDTCCQEF